MTRSDRNFVLMVGAGLFVFAAGLYLWAYAAAGEGLIFGGLIFNPLDGNTYLAKAYQGFEGAWRFKLPYTPDPGSGAYINLYYVFIGHLARWTGLGIPLAYNLARLAGAGFMIAALWGLFVELLDSSQARTALWISALTLGMGWLLIPGGYIPMDLWVAEAYPFLASLTNPHFPLALGLTVILANPASRFTGGARIFRDVILSVLLALVSPFGVVIALLPWAGTEIARAADRYKEKALSFLTMIRSPGVTRMAAILLGGLPILVYDLLAIRADPILAGWDAQNMAQSPPWWDLALSISPALVLAAIGFRRAPAALKGWALLGLLLVFFPFSLQRRFLMGLYIPVSGLAAVGWSALKGRKRKWMRLVLVLCFVPGPLIALLTAQSGILSQNALLYIREDEMGAFEWIEANTAPDDLILAAPETGLFIPAYTGREVIYGHPFETLDAEDARASVEAFYGGLDPEEAAAWLLSIGVDFVFFGPRESAIGNPPEIAGLEIVFEQDQVRIYRMP